MNQYHVTIKLHGAVVFEVEHPSPDPIDVVRSAYVAWAREAFGLDAIIIIQWTEHR